MSTANRAESEKIIEIKLEKGDYNLSLNELLKKRKLIENRPVFIKYKGREISYLDYYYNQEGVVEFHKSIGEVPIRELQEYGYEINNKITLVFYEGGMGASGGFDFIYLIEQIELFEDFFFSESISISIVFSSSSIRFLELLMK